MSDGSHDTKTGNFLLLLAAGLAQFIVCADYFAIAIALPPMAKDLGVRAIDLHWVITGYILAFASTLCVAGVLGDRYGRKKILLLGIVIFAAVSCFFVALLGWVGRISGGSTDLVAIGISSSNSSHDVERQKERNAQDARSHADAKGCHSPFEILAR